MNNKELSLQDLNTFLKHHLIKETVTFWETYAIDRKHGGLFSCINDEGVIGSSDKYMWSQARGLWSFSALHNRIEQRPEWLDIANGLFAFTSKHGRNENSEWVFCTTENGAVQEGPKSIVTDAFGIFGMVEYAKLTGNQHAIQIAKETAESVQRRLAKPGSYLTAPYPTPEGMKAHREFMQYSLAFCELGKLCNDREWLDSGLAKGREVLDHFTRANQQVLLEYINLDNSVSDTPQGRCMVPGHGIESSYFQLLNFKNTHEEHYLDKACETIHFCLEKGWDNEHGGLFLGIDVEGKCPVFWKNAELKLWWVHAEALAACLLAYEHCREKWCLEWYWRIHHWSFARFPVKEYGEWTQRLSRDGNQKVDKVVALPVKDPFHLIRALIVSIETLDRILS